MPIQLRTLTAEDAVPYHELRLRAFREYPEAFATTYEEERGRPLAAIAKKLEPGPEQATLGAFLQNILVGIITITRPAKARLRHRATITAMYVVPEARGQKVGQLLLEQAIKVANGWGVADVVLGVTVGNLAAKNLYTRTGFTTFAVDPRCLCVNGRYYDVEWMMLQLQNQ